MKKAFFKLMLVVLGLNVFTACYGPAPGWTEEEDPIEATDETKAADQTQEGESAEKTGEEAQ